MSPQDSQNDPIVGNDENAEFDAAFDELAGDSPAPDTGVGQDEGKDADLEEPGGPGAEDVGADDPSAQEDPAPAGETPDQNDIWANVPPEVRKAFEAQETQILRLKGQISSRDRQLDQFMRSQQQSQDEGEKKADIKELLKSERLQQLREDYPEFEPLLESVDVLADKVTDISKSVEQDDSQLFEQMLDQQVQILEKDHPDWLEYAKPDENFTNWIMTQPRHVREAAQRNAEYIYDAAEVSDVLSRYKAFKQGANGGQSGEPETSQPDPRRAAQMAGARSIKASYPAAAAGIPDDFDAAFDLLAAKEDQRLSRSGNRRA